jgi:glycosyltransferase involved in cell wall biosynthesis
MSKRILYVMDDPDWVQGRRHSELQRRIPQVELAPLTTRAFARRWRVGLNRRRPFYLASWRQVKALRAQGVRLGPNELERAMTSVTSHYEIGGGLNASAALRDGADPDSTFASAVATLRGFAVVTVNSSVLRDLLGPQVPRLVYAPNGVDADFYRPPDRRAYDPERPRIGWAGKFKRAKNVEVLQAAAAALEAEGFRFEIVGGGKSEEPALDAAGMRAFYERIDWYLCTSWHEGTPNPALEAAACGVPPVTTRVGNMVDLVRDGENGFFVEPTVESVVDRLRALRGLDPSEHARLGNRVRAAIEADWTWERNIAPYREAFQQLAARNGRS